MNVGELRKELDGWSDGAKDAAREIEVHIYGIGRYRFSSAREAIYVLSRMEDDLAMVLDSGGFVQ